MLSIICVQAIVEQVVCRLAGSQVDVGEDDVVQPHETVLNQCEDSSNSDDCSPDWLDLVALSQDAF